MNRIIPPALHRHLGDQAPTELMFLGNPEVLKGRLLALFCSVRCPGNLILQTYDAARELRQAQIAVIGGFHSPMEKECLRLLLRGSQPIVVCPARSIEQLRLPREWKTPIAEGRLLLLSPFSAKQSRTTLDLARKRNHFVAALSEEIFVAHAEAGSKTEAFCRTWLQAGKRIYLPADDRHNPLFAEGAVAVRPAEIRTLLLR
ncbi:MAG: DNA-processing protein DprA [Acidobacteria bacterium]|nr:DNA-processing protein DprA [Acidobacteriota bacterium]